jgi:hypothetical protein
LIARAGCAKVPQTGDAMTTLIERVKGILVAPASEWQGIERESGDASVLFTRYVAILALIPALSRFIGTSLIGGYTPVSTGLAGAITGYLLTFVVVYAIALIIHMLAPRFGGQTSLASALKLAVYSYTPAWLAGIFLLVPGLSFLTILGLYGSYLLWTGLPPLMHAPPEKALPYAAAVVGCALVLAVMLGVMQVMLFSG